MASHPRAAGPSLPWQTVHAAQKQDAVRSQLVDGYFGTGRILGGCWRGQSRKGKRWVFCPRLCVPSLLDAAQGPEAATRKNTPTTGLQPWPGWLQKKTGGRHRSGALGSKSSGHSGTEECVFICCVLTASDFSIRQESELSRRGRGVRSQPEVRWRTPESFQSPSNDY